MHYTCWLRRLFPLSTPRRTQTRHRQRRQLNLEALEGRIVPTWIGATSGATVDAAHDYNNPGNWVGGIIDDSFAGVTFTADTTLNFSADRATTVAGVDLNYLGNASLTFQSDSATLRTLTLNGAISGDFAGSSNGRTVTLGAIGAPLNVDLNGGTVTFGVTDPLDFLVVNNVVTNGSLTKSGTGSLTLNGANNYNGQTLINQGTVNAQNNTALGTTVGGTVVASGASLVLAGFLNVGAEALTLSGTGVNGFGAVQNFIGNNSFAGNITLAADTTINPNSLGAPNQSLTLTGNVGETGGSRALTVMQQFPFNPGTLFFQGNGSYTGGTVIEGVAFALTGGTLAGSVQVTNCPLSAMGFFGIGTVGDVSLDTATFHGGSFILPGGGVANVVVGVLNTGNLSFGPNSVFGPVNFGNTVGTGTSPASPPNQGYGQVRVTGTVTIDPSAAGMQVFAFFPNTTTSTPHQPIIFISNDGTDPISGTFPVRPEGTVVGQNGLLFKITYKGGDGNDFAFLPIEATTTTVTTTGSPTVFGQPIAITATVAGTNPNSPIPQGIVTLLDNNAPIFQSTLDAAGKITFTTSTLPAGGHTITASYPASDIGTSASFQSSSGSFTQFVNQAATTATVTSTGTPTVFGQTVTFTATVAGTAPSTAVGTGTVDFLDGNVLLGTRSLINGTATLVSASLPAGSHGITVVFAGNANLAATTSAVFTQTVSAAATTTTLSSLLNPSPSGNVNLSATVAAVAPGAGIPTGTVTFFDGSTPLGVGNLINGTATFTTFSLSNGAHTLTATYKGDGNDAASTSAPVLQGVGGGVAGGSGQVLVTGADAGGGPEVRVLDAQSGAMLASFAAFDVSFTGGVRVALGDVNGDGAPDIIAAAGAGGGPNVRVFDGKSLQLIANFFAYDAGFQGGVYLAAGDVNGDGKADIITGAGAGGGPNVKVFSGSDLSVLQSYFAYDAGFQGGVTVAAGDVNGDGKADIITGAGAGGGPHVKVFDGGSGGLLSQFFAYDQGFQGGVFVAAGTAQGGKIAQVITGAGAGGGPDVRTFNGATGALLSQFFAFDPSFTGGVRVSTAANLSGTAIVVAKGPGSDPLVKEFDPATAQQLASFFAYDKAFQGGVFVGGKS